MVYESESNIGFLRRTYDEISPLVSYSSYRFDSFHQVSLPETLFGWLSIVPRVGVRGTYYSRSSPDDFNSFSLENLADDTKLRSTLALNPNDASLVDQKNINQARTSIHDFVPEGGLFRPVVNAGVEMSFKLSRVYEQAQSRALGLDRLQHIVQPYLDFAETEDFGVGSRRLLAFDRVCPPRNSIPLPFRSSPPRIRLTRKRWCAWACATACKPSVTR